MGIYQCFGITVPSSGLSEHALFLKSTQYILLILAQQMFFSKRKKHSYLHPQSGGKQFAIVVAP
jgi:hypothetical protein